MSRAKKARRAAKPQIRPIPVSQVPPPPLVQERSFVRDVRNEFMLLGPIAVVIALMRGSGVLDWAIFVAGAVLLSVIGAVLLQVTHRARVRRELSRRR